jgi:hypothetical protein
MVFIGLTTLIIKDVNSNIKEINTEPEDCSENFYATLTQIVFKCSLAFLAGGLIGDIRYLKTGFI